MQFAELKAFIQRFKQQASYVEITKTIATEKEIVFAHSLKIGEELGELNEQLLGKFHHQRKEKADRFSDEKLGLELADIVLSTAMLADELHLDLGELLNQKMAILREKMEQADWVKG